MLTDEHFDLFVMGALDLADERFNLVRRFDPVLKVIADLPLQENGFLGLNISAVEAIWATAMLRRKATNAWPIPARYKDAICTIEQARLAAQQFIDNASRADGHKYDPPSLAEPGPQSPMCHVYKAPSPTLQAAGVVPGVLHIYIDRVTGQPWTGRETEEWALLAELIGDLVRA